MKFQSHKTNSTVQNENEINENVLVTLTAMQIKPDLI